MDGVEACDARVASAGKKPLVWLRLLLRGNPGYERVHVIASTADHEVRRIIPNARVLIRSQPEAARGREFDSAWELVRRVAEAEPGSRGAHNVQLHSLGEKIGVDFHLVVSAGLSDKQAREVASKMEAKLKAADSKISEVVIHTETTTESVSSERSGRGTELRWYVDHVVKRFPEARLAGPPAIRQVGEGRLRVTLRASLAGGHGTEAAARTASKLEAAIREGCPRVVQVDVLPDPADPSPVAPAQ